MGDSDAGGGGIDQRLVRALAHPLRIEILHVLEAGPSSPSQIAGVLDQRLGNVSYHMSVLLKYDCVELVDTRPARGAVQHRYRLKPGVAVGSGTWKEVPQSLRSYTAADTLSGFIKRAVEALDGGTMESREGSGLSWLPLLIDEIGWEELRHLLSSVEERFRVIAEKSAKRLEDPAKGISAIVGVAAFEAAGHRDVGSS